MCWKKVLTLQQQKKVFKVRKWELQAWITTGASTTTPRSGSRSTSTGSQFGSPQPAHFDPHQHPAPKTTPTGSGSHKSVSSRRRQQPHQLHQWSPSRGARKEHLQCRQDVAAQPAHLHLPCRHTPHQLSQGGDHCRLHHQPKHWRTEEFAVMSEKVEKCQFPVSKEMDKLEKNEKKCNYSSQNQISSYFEIRSLKFQFYPTAYSFCLFSQCNTISILFKIFIV